MHPESTSPTLTTTLLPPEPEKSSEQERLGMDEVLSQYAGDFGPWQIRHFALVTLAWVVCASHTMVIIFADREPAWRCTGETGLACRPGPLESVCELEPGSWEWVAGPAASTVAQWGLVCGERFKVGLAQSAFFAGCMIGCGIFGHLSDSFLGRKGSLTTLCIMDAIFGILTSASPSYVAYVLLRVLTGLSTGAIGPCAFLLATEPIGRTYRAAAGMSVYYLYSAGIVMLSAAAYFIQSWRALYIVSSLPTLLFLIAALPFVSESPRWYLIRGKPSKALEIIHKIAEKNGRQLPDKVSLVLDSGTACEHSATSSSTTIIIDVFRSQVTRGRLVLAVIINFLCSIVYYGLNLNIANLSTNLYISCAANAVAEVPAYALTALFLDRFGRKPLLLGTMWLSGVSCTVGSLAGGAAGFGRTGCSVAGIFGMAASFNLLLVYEAELFPTAVRNSALGCIQQAVQLAAIAAPMVVVMRGRAALAVFGICGIAGGILTLYLPETLNKPLYDTMAGMEEGERKQTESNSSE